MRASDRLQIYPDVPLPDVLKPVVVDKCRGAVALGLSLGALTLIDDILTVRRLRFHPESRISLLLTPEGKLRASYLGLGVKGRPTTLQCVGVCGRLRHSSDFSYNARRAASQVQLVWTSEETPAPGSDDAESGSRVICYGCAAAEDAVSLLVSRVFRSPAVWAGALQHTHTHTRPLLCPCISRYNANQPHSRTNPPQPSLLSGYQLSSPRAAAGQTSPTKPGCGGQLRAALGANGAGSSAGCCRLGNSNMYDAFPIISQFSR